jgi:thiol:disulfide interchange protein
VTRVLIVGAIIALIATVLPRLRAQGPPEYFDTTVTLAQAEHASAESGRAVLAFVTADWCVPCQKLKRGALSDERVSSWIRESTHPVYIDVTDGGTPEADRVGAQYLPTLALMRDGKVVSRTSGVIDTKQMLEFLAEHSGPVADEKARGTR